MRPPAAPRPLAHSPAPRRRVLPTAPRPRIAVLAATTPLPPSSSGPPAPAPPPGADGRGGPAGALVRALRRGVGAALALVARLAAVLVGGGAGSTVAR